MVSRQTGEITGLVDLDDDRTRGAAAACDGQKDDINCSEYNTDAAAEQFTKELFHHLCLHGFGIFIRQRQNEIVPEMSEIIFPDPRRHEFSEWVLFGDYYYNARDIVGFGGELSIGNLVNAYRRGIFPWHIDGLPLPWYCPEARAILRFGKFHKPRSLRREFQKTRFTFTIDRAFDAVIRSCADVLRGDGLGTWITPAFIDAYNNFHAAGYAHSVEVWDGDELVGGLYGVDAGGVFCGESMFHKRSNASKFALIYLIEHLTARGATWLDVQVMTPHFAVLGAEEIPRADFLEMLEAAQKEELKLFGE